MGIRSEPFRGVVLSGDDIEKFETQVKKHVPNKAAVATAKRGLKLATLFERKGCVVFTVKRRAVIKAKPMAKAKAS